LDISQTRDVFTPTKPARIAFVERDSVNDKLVNALKTPGKQIVVYGHSGTGKTTLLVNKLAQLYERHITTRCMKGLTFEQLLLDAFDQLAPFYAKERETSQKQTFSAEIGASYEFLKSKIASQQSTESSEKQSRILPPQLTPQALGKFLGTQQACWILEDFHKIDDTEKQRLSQLMKVFMDLSDDYPDLKIIALGAVDTARQVVDYDLEMRNRVAEIHVTLMTEKEITAIIEKGEQALNIEINPDVKRVVTRHSNGLASVCHHLCLNMCDAAGITETQLGARTKLTRDHFDRGLKDYVDEASDSIKSAFDKALKKRRKTQYSNATLILRAIAAVSEDGAARIDIHKKIIDEEPKYPEMNLKYLLPKLCTAEYGNLLRFDSNSGRYSFSDPIYRVYALAKFGGGSVGLKFHGIEQILLRFIREKINVDGPSFKVEIVSSGGKNNPN
jgi:energy-coupling factor transporter ATP-binding protein EcfA2